MVERWLPFVFVANQFNKKSTPEGIPSKTPHSQNHAGQDVQNVSSNGPGIRRSQVCQIFWGYGEEQNMIVLCIYSFSGVFKHEIPFDIFWHLLYVRPTEKETKKRAGSREIVRTLYSLGCRRQLANTQVEHNNRISVQYDVWKSLASGCYVTFSRQDYLVLPTPNLTNEACSIARFTFQRIV